MTTYGILLVDTSWANHDTTVIDKATFTRHKDDLKAGTKALIYVREPVDAIVAEAEITSSVIETEADAEVNPAVTGNLGLEGAVQSIDADAPPVAYHDRRELAHSYRVPLNIVRLKGRTAEIRLNRLQMILGSDFSVFDETWIPLGEEQYQAITAVWRATPS